MKNRKQIIQETVLREMKTGFANLPKGTQEKAVKARLGKIDKQLELLSPEFKDGPPVVQAARKAIKEKIPSLKRKRARLLRIQDKIKGDGPSRRMRDSELG
jgi:hypothetical protein